MPAYDATRHDPPAPVAEVQLRPSSGGDAVISGVPLLIDTGADVTLLPRSAVERLGVEPKPGEQYELIGFDGTRSKADSVELDMIFLNKAFRGRYLLVNQDRGVLGRDVLASVTLLFDGPQQQWSEFKLAPPRAG
jgi:predicted aspartyl protease